MDDGDVVTLDITVTVDVGTSNNTITNTTSAANGDQDDPTTTGDDLEEAITVNNDSDLVTVKTLQTGSATPDEGATLVYRITVTNNGAAQATNVSLDDDLPAGVSYVGDVASQGAYVNGTGIWTIGTMDDGDVVTLDITVTVDVGTSNDTITNTTTAANGDQDDPTTTGDDLEEAITVNNDSDLVTTKVVDDSTPDEGGTVVYTLTVTNNGAAQATNVSLTDQLPTGVTYVSDSASQGAYVNGTGIWTIGTMDDGDVVTLNITATVDVGTSNDVITNTTTAADGDQNDPTTTGDDLEEDITVNNDSDLVTTKVVDDSTPDEGGTVVYTLTVTNNGAAQATNVSLTDQLPTGVTYVSDSASQGAYVNGTGIWTIGTMDNGDVVTLNITATVDIGTSNDVITNTTTAASGDQDDPTTTGDDLEEEITVNNDSDLVTTKVVDDTTPDEGGTIYYTITVINNGAAQATNVSLTDVLPIGVTYVSDIVTQGSYDNISGLWSIGTLDNGAPAVLQITATVDIGTSADTITNTTTAADGDQDDPTTDGDDLEEEIVVNNDADLVTTKVVDNATPNEGDTIIYTLTVTNNGAAQATNVSLTDVLPVGVTYVSDDGSGSYDSVTGLWSIGTLDNGATAILNITATVNIGTSADTITNITTAADSDQDDPTTDGDDLEEGVVVNNDADLVTTKVVDNNTPNEGDTIIYTLTVTNNGAAQATNVSLIDQLPVGVTYVSDVASQGVYDNVSGLWSIGTIDNGNFVILAITVLVDAGTSADTITNTTTAADGDQDDPTADGDDLEEEVVVNNDADLVTTKVVDNEAPNEGDAIIYTITVTNNGVAQATNVSLTDVLPVGVTYVSDVASQGAYDNVLGLWAIGTIDNGDSATLNITVMVDLLTAGTLINNITSNAAGDQDDPTTDGDDLEEEIEIIPTCIEVMNGTFDICELLAGDPTNPLGQEDCDGDGVINITECEEGTDPSDPCDYIAADQTVDPSQEWNGLDCDGDGVTNGDELEDGTDPLDPCDLEVSSQTLPPSEEWNGLDCDGDGVTNGDELEDGTDPLDPCDLEVSSQTLPPSEEWNDLDCDGDGVTNGDEIGDGTDPLDPCDYDFESQTIDYDIPEVIGVDSGWLELDCDNDGLPNGNEISDNNDNGIPDYDEINNSDPDAEDDLEIFDIMTPNGDGLNDVFVIRGIHNYPNNTVEIYNRWGVRVYETQGYGVNNNFFRGFSNGRTTINQEEKLPVGTYYYILVYENNEGETKKLAGPLYINIR